MAQEHRGLPRRVGGCAMRRSIVVTFCLLSLGLAFIPPASGRDRPFGTARMVASVFRAVTSTGGQDGTGNADPGGQYSKTQIEAFRCTSQAGSAMGTPATA